MSAVPVVLTDPSVPRRRYARKVEVGRLIAAVKAHGLDVGLVRLSPDGTIEVVERRSVPQEPADDFARAEAAGLI